MSMRTKVATLVFLLAAMLDHPAVAAGLGGSAWRLLNIASMDDSTAIPDDPNKYTLGFDLEGRVAIRADCNRASGKWSSESAGQLAFGPLAATRALCNPDSLSGQYLAQFEWVRSYTMREGHLFLATMADGSIIEFEPLPPVAATVFGEQIHAADAGELQSAIITRLFDDYAAKRGIEVADPELTAYLDKLRSGLAARGLTAEDDLTPQEALQLDGMRRKMGYAMIRQWKINKSLHERYGGRIIYQQLGPEPLDAYRQYFRERQSAGDFSIENPVMAEQFWGYFTDESRHTFMEPGAEDAARAFAVPPWQEAPDAL